MFDMFLNVRVVYFLLQVLKHKPFVVSCYMIQIIIINMKYEQTNGFLLSIQDPLLFIFLHTPLYNEKHNTHVI